MSLNKFWGHEECARKNIGFFFHLHTIISTRPTVE